MPARPHARPNYGQEAEAESGAWLEEDYYDEDFDEEAEIEEELQRLDDAECELPFPGDHTCEDGADACPFPPSPRRPKYHH